MDKHSIDTFREQFYNGIKVILENERYYYESSVSSDYNHLTQDGINEVVQWVSIMAPHILKLATRDIEDHAKKLMLDTIKN
jgi:hypothetical protein